MSGRSSRLHALERGLKAPRKSRAKARALTVMRLEDSAIGVQSNTRSARLLRLPMDMEDQIAIVRGRAVGKPSRGLLQLEERLLRPRDVAPTQPATQRYAHGSMPTPAAPTSQAHALSAQMAGGEFGGRYNVESFEDTSGTSPGQPVAPPRTEYYAGTAPTTITPIKTALYAGATPATIQSPPVAAVPAVGAVPWAQPRTDISVGAVPWASEQSNRAVRKRALTQDQQAVAENFERDVAAMLGTPSPANAPEDQQWDNTVRNAANTPSVTGAPAVNTPEPAMAPKRDAHEVFNQMGLAMNYANSFDLGAMDLSARFDQFDRELDSAPKAVPSASAPIRVPVQALALDDFDLVADLAEISGAQAAATAVAAAPANQPTTNPGQATTSAT